MLYKAVDGVRVPMSADEEAATLAQWAANEAAAAAQKPATPADPIINNPDALAALKAALGK